MKLKIREQMTAMRKEKIKSFEHKGSDLLAYSGLGISEIRVVPASGPGPRGVSAFAEVVLNGSLTFCGIGIVHSGAEPTVYMPSRIRDSGRRYDVVCAYRDTARSELKKAVFNEYIEASKHRD
jgi:DNA-binding cell septation regulator SpoVG